MLVACTGILVVVFMHFKMCTINITWLIAGVAFVPTSISVSVCIRICLIPFVDLFVCLSVHLSVSVFTLGVIDNYISIRNVLIHMTTDQTSYTALQSLI